MPIWRQIDLGSGGDEPFDRAIAALARRQHRLVTRDQLLRLGLGRSAITYRARTGRLHRVHLGVYSVGTSPATPLELAAAAVLACGPEALLSHHTALTLWGLAKGWPTPPHVIAGARHRRPEIAVHRVCGLAHTDIRTQLGLRVTSPARTVLDCAPGLTPNRLARIAADGRRAGLIHPGALEDVARRFPKHPGVPHLAPVREATPGAPTRSEFEDAFLVFCARFGLPTPRVNTRFNGYEVDALFAAQRLIVELDGWDFHRDRHVFESDRERDAATLAAGLVTVRLTWERLHQTPQQEAERLRTILTRRTGAA